MAGGPTVGLDIGSNQIKAVEMRRSGTGLQVAALGVAPTPQAAYENGVIVDAQVLGQAVKKLLREAGISARQCVSSVSGQAVVVRVIEVPRMSVTELAETMKWEVQRQIPFPADEVIVDYQPIERPGDAADGQNMDVLLAVAQQDMIDRHVSMLFAAGLKPLAIDVEPMAAARCLLDFGAGISAPGHAVAVVNIGASNTDICIFRDKLPAFNRTLPLAGDNLTHAIATALQVDLESAEKYKRELGEVMLDQVQQPAAAFGGAGGAGGFIDFTTQPAPPTGPATPSGAVNPRMPFDFSTEGPVPTPSESTAFDLSGNPIPSAPDISGPASVPGGGPFVPASEPGFVAPSAAPPPSNLPAPVPGNDLAIQVFNAMSPVLLDLAQELRRSIDFYRGKVADGQIHELLLIGGTARLRNLGPYLETELGISTRVVDPLKIVSVASKNFSQSHQEELASVFPVSMGLGAYQMVSSTAGGKKR
jgi:type IV pilus assembly protein PilM